MIYLCYAIMIIVPYLLCGINTAIIVTKIKTGEDIRTLGSGNAGLTNTLRTQGKIAALFVLLGDVLKGTLSILIVRFSFLWLTGTDTANPDNMMTYVGFAAAVAAIIGHVFPIYFGFKGGKGILVSVAVLMTVEWIPACILLGIFIIVVALTRYVSLGSCIAAVCYPVTILVYSLITGDPCVWINVILSALIAVLILFMHRGNLVKKDTIVVNVGKGFEENTDKRLSQVLKEELPDNRIAVLTGPSHAEEIGRNVPTTIVVSSEDEDSMMYLQETLQNDRFRIYRNSDLVGCELGGALKNPIALCCGIVEGMGLGDNTIAALMTRGLAEITRLGVAMGGKRETFDGLSGVGDLIVTCTSSHSRNHRAGLLIGQGIPAAQAVKQVGTVEGYQCAKIAYAIAREHNVQVPIIEQLCEVCYNGQSPLEAVSKLMGRPSKAEEEIF